MTPLSGPEREALAAIQRYDLTEQLTHSFRLSMRMRYSETSGRQCYEREKIDVLLAGYRVVERDGTWALIETSDGVRYELYASLVEEPRVEDVPS